MYNKNIMRAINDVNRTCKDPDSSQRRSILLRTQAIPRNLQMAQARPIPCNLREFLLSFVPRLNMKE